VLAVAARTLRLRSIATRALATVFAGGLLTASLGAYPPPGPVHLHSNLASAPAWLDRFNMWRSSLGLSSLTENTTWSQGDYNHALYMVKNNLVTHYETVGVPYYTSAGATAAQNSNIYVSSSTSTTDVNAIDWWMAAPFHSMGMMDPRLSSTGFGSYREVKSGWDMAAAVDVLRGNSFSGGSYPVFFPGNGTMEPLTTYGGNEFPDPLQACPGYSSPAGLPVYVEVGGNVSTTAGAHSFTGNGVPLAHCVIDSNNSALGGSLRSRGGVVVVPQAPLQSGVKYTVSLTVNGTPYTWSFSVGPLTWGVWSASFDMTGVPTKWTQGVSQTFSVKVTNTGNITWPSTGANEVDLDLHFATASGGSATSGQWLSSLASPLPADVAPGATATVSFTLTPPVGANILEALMIKEHQFWFDKVTTSPVQWAFVPVTVNGQNAVWSASFDLSKVPTNWSQGVSQTIPIKVTNVGNVTWPSTGYTEVDLDVHFASSAGGSANSSHWLTSQALALGGDVAPGASTTVNFTLSAPAGVTVLEALMIKEHQFWFDAVTSSPQQWAPALISVTSQTPVWSATFDMSSVPTSWSQGVSQTFPVKVTNTGNVTWPSTGYNEVDLDLHFASSSGGSANSAHWLTSLANPLGADVAPGGSATVNFTVIAPAGSTVLEALMIKEHQFWFDSVTSSPQQWKSVATAFSLIAATYDLSKAPTAWKVGQSQTFSVTVTNTGTTTWVSTGYNEFDLDFHFTTTTGGSAQQGHWLTSMAFALPHDVLAGQSVTFSVTLTAPSSAGSMFLEAEMIKEHAFWFPQTSAVAVTVS